MPLNVLEVAVYAMVLTASQPRPFECVAVEPQGVNCTNGLAAQPLPDRPGMAFNTGVTVSVTRTRDVVFSNGITVMLDSSAWAHFSRGGTPVVSARRMDGRGTRFSFNNGFQCQIAGPDKDMARCFRQ